MFLGGYRQRQGLSRDETAPVEFARCAIHRNPPLAAHPQRDRAAGVNGDVTVHICICHTKSGNDDLVEAGQCFCKVAGLVHHPNSESVARLPQAGPLRGDQASFSVNNWSVNGIIN